MDTRVVSGDMELQLDIPALGGQKRDIQGWVRNDQGKAQMPALQSEFLDWLLTPEPDRVHKTIKSWAEAHGIAPGTASQWKKDRRFRREWEERADAKNISVERIQNVIDTIYEAAVMGDVQAAKMYLQHIEKMRPPKVVEQDSDLADLSEDELLAEISALVEADRGQA